MSTPGPYLKRLLRAPVALYDIGAGAIFGHRFLLLTHRGRRSGRLFRTMLEVVEWNPAVGEAIVMSGFGARSNWYLNVLAGGAVEIRISRSRFRPEIRQLDAEESVRVLTAYERRNRLVAPVLRAVLSRLAGFDHDGSQESRRRVVEVLPLIAFRQVA